MNTAYQYSMLTITLVSTLWATAPPASAAVINVPADQPTLQAGIDAAVTGDEVVVADGTYTGTGNTNLLFRGKAITVRSASGDPSTCTLGTASGFDQIFTFGDFETRLSRVAGFTIRGSVSIGTNPSTPRPGSPTIVNCTFTGGRGSIYIGHGSKPLISQCVFIGKAFPATPVEIFHGADPQFVNCLFLGNTGGNCGGVNFNDAGRGSFYNCAFIGNSSRSFVGAMWIRVGSVVNLYNCAFVGNQGGNQAGTAWEAGAVRVGYASEVGNTLNVVNCLFWDNRLGDGSLSEESQILDAPGDVANTINIDHSTLQGWTGTYGGTGNNGADPLFVDVDGTDNTPGTLDDDIRLSPTSPAIDSGNNNTFDCVGVDLDLQARFQDDAGTTDTGTGTAPIIDRGPYEFGSAAAALNDCNNNLYDDTCELDEGLAEDCNENGIPDTCDIATGFSADCNGNGIPDVCDLEEGLAEDCNENGIPDTCDIATGFSADCNGNMIPDACDLDDDSEDCNTNGIPDECDIAAGTSEDCNENGTPDTCDLEYATSTDINTNSIPDECEPDCNSNHIPDDVDLSTGTSPDCNANNIPDECDVQPILEEVDFETHPWFSDWATGCDDCDSGTIYLPSPITLRGETYEKFVQDSNGYVELLRSGEAPNDHSFGFVEDLINDGDPTHTYLMAAYSDLSSEVYGSFGYEVRGDRVVFDWLTETFGDGATGYLNHFQIILFTNGTVQWNFATAAFDDYSQDLFSGIYFGHDARQLLEIARETIPEEESWFYGNNYVDCNGNGLPDACEVGLPDCNEDGIPDVCKPDEDEDGVPDECDVCPGGDDGEDADSDGVPDDCDGCPDDTAKTTPGACGCGNVDTDTDGDGLLDCEDDCADTPACATVNDAGCPTDGDADGVPDGCDLCLATVAGEAVDADGCSVEDEDGDGVQNDEDLCRKTPACALASVDADGCPQDLDGDGLFDGCDNCPDSNDLTDGDGDGVPDCLDPCPLVGDTDGDGVEDCLDECPNDPLKLEPGICGCGSPDVDADDNGFPDCLDGLLSTLVPAADESPTAAAPDPLAASLFPCCGMGTAMALAVSMVGLIPLKLARRRRPLRSKPGRRARRQSHST